MGLLKHGLTELGLGRAPAPPAPCLRGSRAELAPPTSTSPQKNGTRGADLPPTHQLCEADEGQAWGDPLQTLGVTSRRPSQIEALRGRPSTHTQWTRWPDSSAGPSNVELWKIGHAPMPYIRSRNLNGCRRQGRKLHSPTKASGKQGRADIGCAHARPWSGAGICGTQSCAPTRLCPTCARKRRRQPSAPFCVRAGPAPQSQAQPFAPDKCGTARTNFATPGPTVRLRKSPSTSPKVCEPHPATANNTFSSIP